MQFPLYVRFPPLTRSPQFISVVLTLVFSGPRLRRATTLPTLNPPVSDIPKHLLYTEEHEYVKPTDEDNVVAIGITDYAQGELGDIVLIELPQIGTNFGMNDLA